LNSNAVPASVLDLSSLLFLLALSKCRLHPVLVLMSTKPAKPHDNCLYYICIQSHPVGLPTRRNPDAPLAPATRNHGNGCQPTTHI
jgi:hypothetical protein